jgi:hypothetical protein
MEWLEKVASVVFKFKASRWVTFCVHNHLAVINGIANDNCCMYVSEMPTRVSLQTTRSLLQWVEQLKALIGFISECHNK